MRTILSRGRGEGWLSVCGGSAGGEQGAGAGHVICSALPTAGAVGQSGGRLMDSIFKMMNLALNQAPFSELSFRSSSQLDGGLVVDANGCAAALAPFLLSPAASKQDKLGPGPRVQCTFSA